MAESVYKIVELVGTSTVSWEKAAAAAVKLASQTLRDLRVAEISKLDMHMVDGKVAYRARVLLSFKYESGASESSSAPARRGGRAKAAAMEEEDEAPAAPKKKARRGKKKAAKG
jgi:flavin-binding protein dodecin